MFGGFSDGNLCAHDERHTGLWRILKFSGVYVGWFRVQKAGEAAATVEQEVMEATAGQVQTPLPAMEMMAMVTEEVILLAKVVSVVDVVEVGAGEAIVVPAEAPVEVEPVVHRATVPAGEGTE